MKGGKKGKGEGTKGKKKGKKMVDLADMNDVYPEYVPDLENYIPASCTYVGVDELFTLISSLPLSI